MPVKTLTKAGVIKKLKAIHAKGWIKTGRPGNDGGVGNTLEDLLGIKENNLPIPNAAEWELKSQRKATGSFTTMFHMEPSPQGISVVEKVLLPNYGWAHQEAGKKYKKGELSFRATLNAVNYSDRGFRVVVDRQNKKISLSFNSKKTDQRHKKWLNSVQKRIGLGEINPQPYWGFQDLEHKAGSKLKNCFFVRAETKKHGGHEHFHYVEAYKLAEFDFKKFLDRLEEGTILVDFDARTGHNHGTKFRIRKGAFQNLYANINRIF